jgi:hypothetical protein
MPPTVQQFGSTSPIQSDAAAAAALRGIYRPFYRAITKHRLFGMNNVNACSYRARYDWLWCAGTTRALKA